jgi:hypothetical protein
MLALAIEPASVTVTGDELQLDTPPPPPPEHPAKQMIKTTLASP